MKSDNRKRSLITVIVIILSLLLAASIGLNIFQYFSDDTLPLSWLQSEDFVNDTILGVLKNSREFRAGEDITFTYDFDNESWSTLRETYGLEKTAGEGSEFVRAKNLMNEFSGRIKHSSSVAVSDENMNALYLLSTYLDKNEGTYCRAKAQILNEMCLSLGIYARKLWIIPLSACDDECHVVNEVWDSQYGKWIMLDISNALYWVDGNAVPLSAAEIRDRMINDEFCTPVCSDSDLKDLQKAHEKYSYYYSYYVKNLAVLKYMDTYTVGETLGCYLLPVNFDLQSEVTLVSREAVEAEPVGENN